MQFGKTRLSLVVACMMGLSGCVAGPETFLSEYPPPPEAASSETHGSLVETEEAEPDRNVAGTRQTNLANWLREKPKPKIPAKSQTVQRDAVAKRVVAPFRQDPQLLKTSAQTPDVTLTIDGRSYRVELNEATPVSVESSDDERAPGELPLLTDGPKILNLADSSGSQAESVAEAIPLADDVVKLNLPTALSIVGGQHPAVGFAQWRVQEAYAKLEQAKVLWLPSIQSGFSVHRHDGNYQASDGLIIDVNRNSFQYGLGAGATGAGTNPRPGVVARFHLADAIFQPQIARTTAWASGHSANGVVNEQLLKVAVAYLDLLDAVQDLRIIDESQERTATVAKLTSDFAAAGRGLQADADRLQTELTLVEDRAASARERIGVASARLAQELSIDAGGGIEPLDATVVPLELASVDQDKPELIAQGLANRPELKEAQALVAAACKQYKRQKYAPFVPSILLGFSTGGFGGGLGNRLADVENRYDLDALATWEIRNLGFGERAARRESHARYQQAKFAKIRMLDRVAREIAEAHSQVLHRGQRISITENAIQTAQASYQRNLSRIRDGQGLPLEVLQSVRALEDARRAYLKAVVNYNEAQFRLQWALGWPVTAPASPKAP